MMESVSKPWFAPKRFGYGAGWPVAWQGWVSVLVYVAALVVIIALVPGLKQSLAIFGVTVVFGWIASRRTEGGWRWRWGR
ncbi:hypothetical protein GOB93_01580 [Acetobacter musti]|uniref:DUF4175 domain-containing protein n=1 Tax=Acetobacter musti TaxID=864732 RepID=A0ABX0JLH2_9PROT|nr:hypothetical protein [Acetobacter musti]NHN83331.1 hypothetical protein [Acetobacter musti]